VNKLISLACLALFSAEFASATELYGEINTSYAFSKIADEKFNPLALETRFGFYLEKQIGLEAYYGTGLSNDKQSGLELSLNTIAGVNLRLESPDTKDGMKVFILLGYGMSEWDVDRSGTGEPGKVDFDDFSYGGGFEWRLGKSENWFVNIRGQRFLNKKDISLDTGSLGVRYAF
tara:strand:- start:42877 stop:43401 length:525 start_codon:yes stop_codon:yes gene_type:complete